MNKIYKIVWSKVQGAYVVVSELAKSHTKSPAAKTVIGSAIKGAALALATAAVLSVGGVKVEAAAAATASGQYVAVAFDSSTNGNGTTTYSVGNTRVNNGITYTYTAYTTGQGPNRRTYYYWVSSADGTRTYIGTSDSITYTYVEGDVRTFTDATGTAHNYVYQTLDANGKAYWVREGYALDSEEGKRFTTDNPNVPSNDILLKAYQTTSDADTVGLLQTSQITTTAGITTLNQQTLNEVSTGTYLGAVNTGGTQVPSSWNYFIERDGKWVDVGGSSFTDNFKAVTYNEHLNAYTFNGEVVSNDNLYAVSINNTVTLGVFTTTAGGSEVYTGRVYGANNEILLTGLDGETYYSYWGAEIDDPNGNISSMTVSQFNETMNTLYSDIVKVHQDNIKQVNVADSTSTSDGKTTTSATISLTTNGGADIPGVVTIAGGDNVTVTAKADESGQGGTITISATDTNTYTTVTAGTKADNGSTTYTVKNIDSSTDKQVGDTYTIVDTDTNTVTTASVDGKTLTISTDGKDDVTFTDTDTDTVTTASVDGKTLTISTDGKDDVTFTDTDTVTTASVDGKTLTISTDGKDDVTFTDTDTVTTASVDGKTLTIKTDGQDDVTFTDTDTITTASVSDDGKTLTITVGDNNPITFTGSDTDTVTTASVSADGKTLTIKTDGQDDVTFNNTVTTASVDGKTLTIKTDGKDDVTFTDTDTVTTASVDGKTLTIKTDGKDDVTFTDTDTVTTASVDGKTLTIKTDGKDDVTFTDTNTAKNDVTTVSGSSSDGTVTITTKTRTDTMTDGEWTTGTESTDTIKVGTLTKVSDNKSTLEFGGNTVDIEKTTASLSDDKKTLTIKVGDNDAVSLTDTNTQNTVSSGSNVTVTPTTVSDGIIDFNVALNDDITVNSLTATTVDATTVNATNVKATTVDATTVNATTVNATDVNATNITANKVTTNELSAGPLTVSNNSISAGGTQIHDVAAGTAETDAVNVGQLQQTQNQVDQNTQNINKISGRVDKVGAGAAALAALHPLDFDPDDKLTFAAGVGNYRSETAAAVGMFYRPDEKVLFSMSSTVGNDNNMVNAGVSFSLDRTPSTVGSRTQMARKLNEMSEKVEQQDVQIEELLKANAEQAEQIKQLMELLQAKQG